MSTTIVIDMNYIFKYWLLFLTQVINQNRRNQHISRLKGRRMSLNLKNFEEELGC